MASGSGCDTGAMMQHPCPLRLRLAGLLLVPLFLTLPAAVLAQAGPPGGGPGGAQQGPREVGVVTLMRESVPVTTILPGRAVAYHETAIRPQVGGEVSEIAYNPGEPVRAGQVLFRLDDAQRTATLAAAEAAVTSARAALQGAQATVNRYDRLQGTGVSKAELETAQVALANARASLSQAEADRDLAQLAVDRSDIRSPIDGVADIAQVSVGDLVTASQSDALTTVTQLDPIYVDVSESRARFLRNIQMRNAGTLARQTGLQPQVILETGQVYDQPGALVAPGRTVSPTTGTVPLRLQFPNPDRLILPGQFLRVELTVGTLEGVLVPQRATRRSASGELTAFVARNGKAEQVTLTESGTAHNAWVVTQGVSAGEALILDGLNNLTAGAAVTTVPVVIDADGVVRNADEAAAGSAAGDQPGPVARADGGSAPGGKAANTPATDSAAAKAGTEEGPAAGGVGAMGADRGVAGAGAAPASPAPPGPATASPAPESSSAAAPAGPAITGTGDAAAPDTAAPAAGAAGGASPAAGTAPAPAARPRS